MIYIFFFYLYIVVYISHRIDIAFLMSKKFSVFEDELDLKHPNGGIYCFFPFDSFDKNKKSIFKIGITTRALKKRGESYHTYFPTGVTTIAYLENPSKGMGNKTRKAYYEEIEKSIIDYIVEETGGYQIKTTAKSINDGKTEWVYTDIDSIIEAFEVAHHKFGGKGDQFLFDDIYKARHKEKLRNKHFVGRIVYPLVDPPRVEAAPKKGQKKK